MFNSHLLQCPAWQDPGIHPRQRGGKHQRQASSQRSCFLGLEMKPELVWEDWDLRKEFTKTLVLKNIHSKLQKLHVRSYKHTWTHICTHTCKLKYLHKHTHKLCVMCSKQCNVNLISIHRLSYPIFVPLQASRVQVLHHLDSSDNCSQPRDFFLHASYL